MPLPSRSAPPGARPASELGWYNLALAGSVAAGGIQGVLFPWLITVHLDKSAQWVGVAQMMSMLPTLLFVLWGGAIADRIEARAYLIRLQLAINIPHLALIAVLAAGALEYWVAILYVLGPGIISAFLMPARDAAIARIAMRENRDLGRAITAATGLQFGGQIVGFGLGGLASEIGPIPHRADRARITASSSSRASKTSRCPRPLMSKGPWACPRFLLEGPPSAGPPARATQF